MPWQEIRRKTDVLQKNSATRQVLMAPSLAVLFQKHPLRILPAVQAITSMSPPKKTSNKTTKRVDKAQAFFCNVTQLYGHKYFLCSLWVQAGDGIRNGGRSLYDPACQL